MDKIPRDTKPSLNQLLCLSFTNDEGIRTNFRLMDRLKPYWRSFAIALKFPHHTVLTLENEQDPLFHLLIEWLRGASQEHDSRPLAWTTFVEALRNANLQEEANILEKYILYTESHTPHRPSSARLQSQSSERLRHRRYQSTSMLHSPAGSPFTSPAGSRPTTPIGSQSGTPDNSEPGFHKIHTGHDNTDFHTACRSDTPNYQQARAKSKSLPEVIIHPPNAKLRSRYSGSVWYKRSQRRRSESHPKSAPSERPQATPQTLSKPRPHSHYDDSRGSAAEVHADAKVVELVRDLQASFSNMLTDIRKLGAKCDLGEVKFFLSDLLDTDDIRKCQSFDDVLHKLHAQNHIGILDTYNIEQLADRCGEDMKPPIDKYNKHKEAFLSNKLVIKFCSNVSDVVRTNSNLTVLTVTIPRLLMNKRMEKCITELANTAYGDNQPPKRLTVVGGAMV